MRLRLFSVLRVIALLAIGALGAAAVVFPAQRGVLALVAGEVAVLGLLAHLFSHDLERLVALRYLRRTRPTRAVGVGAALSLLALAAGVALFLAGHGESRAAETIGAFLIFAAGVAVALFFLLFLFSIFTAVSTLGVALGVASLVVVLAVTSGFEREFKDKVLSVNGHIVATSYGLPDPAEADREAALMEKKLASLPGLAKIEKFSISPGEVMIGKVGANLKGVDLSRGAVELQRALVAGRVTDLGLPATCRPRPALPGDEPGAPEKAGRMIIGVELARKLRVKTGDCVSVLVPFPDNQDDVPPSYLFKLVGLFHFGFNEYDTRLAYVNLDDAKGLAGARQSVFGVELRFHDPMDALAALPETERRLGNEFHVMDWRTLNGNLFAALTMQKVVISVILLIIIVVAAFNILASLYLIVVSKKREIAILSSMGARARPILGIFLSAGAMVGMAGGGLGLAFGLTLCAVVARFGYSLDPKVYLIERLPVEISAAEALLVPAVAISICLLATLYPAAKASRLRAVDGLRYD